MVNRVLLDQNGLFVSKPGVDVLSAQPKDLQFSSDYGTLNVLKRGVLNLPATPEGYPVPGNGAQQVTVNFGKTFSARPPVFFAVRRTVISNPKQWYQHIGSHIEFIYDGPNRIPWYGANVFNSRFVFQTNYNSDSFLNGPWEVFYIIWDYDL